MVTPVGKRNRLFYLWVSVRLLVLVLLIVVISVTEARLNGGLGVAIAITGGILLGLALLLANSLLADWLNLRALRHRRLPPGQTPEAGAVAAVEGVLQVEGEPLRAPFSDTECAAYYYRVNGLMSLSQSGSRSGRQALCLQGFALRRTRLEREGLALGLLSLPAVETDLQRTETGGDWGRRALALIATGAAAGAHTGERDSTGQLLEARRERIGQVQAQHFVADLGNDADQLTVIEEVVPAGETVTVVGTLEADPPGMSGRRRRPGGNLIVFLGDSQTVVQRLQAELSSFGKVLAVLALLALACIGLPYLPDALLQAVPFLDALVVR